MTYTTIRKVDGPPCPRCGCQDGELLRSDEKRIFIKQPGGQLELERIETQMQLACKHCDRVFRAVASEYAGDVPGKPVSFERLRCPHCGSPRTKVTSSPATNPKTGIKRRSHRCDFCARPFTSREKPED